MLTLVVLGRKLRSLARWASLWLLEVFSALASMISCVIGGTGTSLPRDVAAALLCFFAVADAAFVRVSRSGFGTDSPLSFLRIHSAAGGGGGGGLALAAYTMSSVLGLAMWALATIVPCGGAAAVAFALAATMPRPRPWNLRHPNDLYAV